MRRIDLLMGLAEDDPAMKARIAIFRQGLETLAWSEGRNVRIDYRYAPAATNVDQAQVLAKELVAVHPDLILAGATPIVTALQRETRAIPIVLCSPRRAGGPVIFPPGRARLATKPEPIGSPTPISGKWLAMPMGG
jgi:putative ABC transport system substrate-binding protein